MERGRKTFGKKGSAQNRVLKQVYVYLRMCFQLHGFDLFSNSTEGIRLTKSLWDSNCFTKYCEELSIPIRSKTSQVV
jgi:hypothetical protein